MFDPLYFVKNIVKLGALKSRILLSFAAIGFYSAAMVAQPFLIALIVREMAQQSTMEVRVGVVFLAAAMALSGAMAYAVAEINNSVLQDIRCSSKCALYECLLSKPLEFFHGLNQGSIEAAVATASQAVRTIVFEGLNALVRALFFIIFSAVLVFVKLPVHGSIFVVAAAFYCCMAYRLARSSSRHVADAVLATVSASKEVSDIVFNIDSVVGNDMGYVERNRISTFLEVERAAYRKAQALMDRNDFLQRSFLALVFIVFIVSVAASGGGDAASAVMLYVIGLISYVQLDTVGKSLNTVFEQLHKLETVLEGLKYGVVKDEPLQSAIFDTGAVGVDIDHVFFHYVEGRPLLCDLCIKLEPAGRYLITGPSGTGKSSLLKILAGRLEPQAGQVRYAGRAARALSRRDRSRLMSIIPQDAKLFDRSVYANATYGLEHVPYDEVQTLLLGLKLERLQRQEGACWLDAGVGKDGLDLSGGERQRILLARAILQARPLLLLDEATSALDAQTEAAVLQLLHERLPDTTIVAVSHRPHAQQAGYRTLALDQGAMP